MSLLANQQTRHYASTTIVVKNFFPSNSNRYTYKCFSPRDNRRIEFFTRIYPNNVLFEGKSEQKEVILLALKMNKIDRNEMAVYYKVYIIDDNHVERFTKEFIFKYFDTKEMHFVNLADREFILLMDNDNEISRENLLKVKIEVRVLQEKVTQEQVQTIAPKLFILEDLQTILEKGKLSDVLLCVGGKKEFHAHKAILGARSAVFAAMFDQSNKSKEALENRVEILDVSVEVFEHFLRYIYTDKVEDKSLEMVAFELLAVADKYQVDRLKQLCEQCLNRSINIESVFALLILADMHNSTQLKSKCINFITNNATNVMDTEDWKEMSKKASPELLVHLFQELAIKKSK